MISEVIPEGEFCLPPGKTRVLISRRRRQGIPLLLPLQRHGKDFCLHRSIRHICKLPSSSHPYPSLTPNPFGPRPSPHERVRSPPLSFAFSRSSADVLSQTSLKDNTSDSFYFLFFLGLVSCGILFFLDIPRSRRQCRAYLDAEVKALHLAGKEEASKAE